MEPRTDLDLNALRSRLNDEMALAQQAIDGTRASHNDGTGEPGMEQNETSLGADDNHPADLATDVQLRTQDDALMRNAREILSKIQAALARMDDGTYGYSEKSGAPISAERLDAVPYATLTMEEQIVSEGDLVAPLGTRI